MSNQNVVKAVFRWDDEQPPRMDAEFKVKWLEALRSGKYTQGTGSLKYWFEGTYKYCCLGVAGDLLCDNLPEGSTKVAWHYNTTIMAWSDAKERYIEEEGLLPEVLNEKIGLSTSDGVVARWYVDDYYGDEDYLTGAVIPSLTDLNDGGMTFNQIADVIEYFL